MKLTDMTTMTPEWTHIANSIQVFVIRERMSHNFPEKLCGSDLRGLYNRWSHINGIAIESTPLALWCVDYIRKLINMPLVRLKAAADMDGLCY